MSHPSRARRPSRYPPTESDRPYSHTIKSDSVRPEDSISNHPPRHASRRGPGSNRYGHNVFHPSSGAKTKPLGRSREQSNPDDSLCMAVLAAPRRSPSTRWPPDNKRLSVRLRYRSDQGDYSCHVAITKLPDQPSTKSTLQPRYRNERPQGRSIESQSRPRKSDRDYRGRHHTTRHSGGEKARDQGGNHNGSTRRHRSGDGSMMTVHNTKSMRGEYETDFRETMVSPVMVSPSATEAAATRRMRSSRSKNESSLPKTSGAPIHGAYDGPTRMESDSVSHGNAGRSRRQSDLPTHETATQTNSGVGGIDSAFNDHFRSHASTSEPTDEKRSRPEQTTRRSSNKHPSRPERTELGGHPTRHHSRPDDGSHYAYEKSKKTTTYRSGCCTIL